MALACFSLSLLIQVHEAAAVVESGGGSPLDASIAAALLHRSCLMHLNE